MAKRLTDDPNHLFTIRIDVAKRDERRRFVTIYAFDGNHCDPRTGHNRIDVVCTLDGKTVFAKGDTWCATPCGKSIDGKDAKELVCSLIAMKPGDTDADYFKGYTLAQLAFAEEHGEYIAMIGEDRYGES